MTRLQADALLLLTAIIWGTAFVTQKTGMEQVGPYTFVANRFIISAILVLPFAWLEARNSGPVPANSWRMILVVAVVFAAAMIFQQLGLKTTSVTNAGFITALYVVITPFVAWALLKRRPRNAVWIAALTSLIGVFLLTYVPTSGSDILTLNSLGLGDAQILASAVLFALQIALLGLILPGTPRPITIMLVQSLLCVAIAAPLAFASEPLSIQALWAAAPEIAYAGAVAGALGFSFQAIGQQYSPPGDAAIIMSSEALWAALAGALFLGERLSKPGLAGCAMIILAILIVELAPKRKFGKSSTPSS